MSNIERATATFQEKFSCSQAVLSAFAPELGLNREVALKVAGAFGGGMARTGQTCGAVTGALMVIGLKHGQILADDLLAKEKTYALAQEFLKRFQERHGATLCPALLGYDIGDPQEMQIAKDKGLFTSLCPRLVADAAEILQEIL
jgi:C_GCAxxG_C_C family probable redox protein